MSVVYIENETEDETKSESVTLDSLLLLRSTKFRILFICSRANFNF
jgi:hypothetical protein